MARSSIMADFLVGTVDLLTPLLPDVMVTLGYDVTQNYGDALWIGVDDPTSTAAAAAATFDQEWAGAAYTIRNETGEVVCAISSSNGDGDPVAALRACERIFNLVEEQYRVKANLNIEGLNWTNISGGSYSQDQDDQGCYGLLIFRIQYRARI